MSKLARAIATSFALALVSVAPASASLKIVAPATVEGAQPVRFAATAPQSAEEVAFYVDGRRRFVDYTPGWKFGRSGRVELGVGRHLLKVRATEGSSVAVTTRTLEVSPTGDDGIAGDPVTETVPPVPTHEPSPANSELLFDGARVDDFGLIQAAPNAITEVPDPTGSGESVLKLTVDEQDVAPITPTENPRAQALSPGVIDPGDEIWLSTKFMLPKDMPSIPSWLGLVSIYGAPFDGPSPWCLEINENEFRWQRNGTYNWDIPWRAPLIKGRWVNLLMHERFDSNGFIEMWIDGQKITFFPPGNHNPDHHPETDRLQMATMDASNYAAPNAAKIMQYRKVGMFKSASVYFGHLKLGTTRAAVE